MRSTHHPLLGKHLLFSSPLLLFLKVFSPLARFLTSKCNYLLLLCMASKDCQQSIHWQLPKKSKMKRIMEDKWLEAGTIIIYLSHQVQPQHLSSSSGNTTTSQLRLSFPLRLSFIRLDTHVLAPSFILSYSMNVVSFYVLLSILFLLNTVSGAVVWQQVSPSLDLVQTAMIVSDGKGTLVMVQVGIHSSMFCCFVVLLYSL